MEKITKKKFVSGAVWKITESVAAKGVSFIVSLILARLLTPGDYGIIAITTIFINLSDVLIDGGFSTALVRKKNVEKCDYNCVFMASLGIACVLYLLIFIGAPYISIYYNTPLLTPVLRVIGLMLFIQAFSATRNAVIQRNMKFKLLFYSNMIGSLISGIVGIIAAVYGLGVWALVIQQLSQQIFVTIILFSKLHWKFEWQFEWNRFRDIFSFSIGVMGAGLLNYIGSSLYNLVIGKKYSVTDLGYSDKGSQLPMQASLYTFSAMSSVLLPTLSSYQEDLPTFKIILRKVVNMTAYLVFPMMIGMAVVSEELIVVLLTDKWLPALRIMQYSCIYYIATPFMLINVQIFYALGHGFLRIKTELIRISLLLLGLIIFAFGFRCNISQLALINSIIAVIITGVTCLEVNKILGYRISEFIKDVYKPCLSAMLMGGIVLVTNRLVESLSDYSVLLRLMFDVVIGGLTYFVLSFCLKMEAFVEIKKHIMSIKKKQGL